MVSGGPYGLEDIIGKAGYWRGLLMLAVLPFLWSLPAALMVGELASTLPNEGGYYVWVHRALGRFWGFQEAWLSLAASVFDMAIYPTLFVLYLSRVAPSWTAGDRATLWALTFVLVSLLWNLRGAKAVGDSSLVFFCLLLAPFVVLVAVALWRWHGHGTGALLVPAPATDLAGAISVTLWQYMGWDAASTVAQEVQDPQRNYPRAMLGTTVVVVLTYMLPLFAVGLAGMATERFSTGAWTDAATALVGPWLGLAVVLGGIASAGGMFNPLMMSYARLPPAMAQDGLLPRSFRRENRFGAPYVALVCCAALWALALRFSFERLISIDLVLYGASLLLEFVALVVLRHREPDLPRPFRVPGGMTGAVLSGVGPALLIVFALWAARAERVGPLPAPLFAALVGLSGAVVYGVAQLAGKAKARRLQPGLWT